MIATLLQIILVSYLLGSPILILCYPHQFEPAFNVNNGTNFVFSPEAGRSPVIIKSDLDTREYRHITLAENELDVLLIYDKDTDHASASMSVGVGK